MLGDILHGFDRALCRHVFDVIGSHWECPGFVTFIEEQLEAPVVAHLKSLSSDGARRDVLLNADELLKLSVAFGGGPIQFDLPWIPYHELCRRSIACVPDIRSLAKEYVNEWATRSAKCTRRFQRSGLPLHAGIETVAEWVEEVRRLLLALGRADLVPCPMGTLPTLTCQAPLAPQKPSRDQKLLERVRAALAHPATGRQSKPDRIIERTNIRRQDCLRALRQLRDLGEYEGFAR